MGRFQCGKIRSWKEDEGGRLHIGCDKGFPPTDCIDIQASFFYSFRVNIQPSLGRRETLTSRASEVVCVCVCVVVRIMCSKVTERRGRCQGERGIQDRCDSEE